MLPPPSIRPFRAATTLSFHKNTVPGRINLVILSRFERSFRLRKSPVFNGFRTPIFHSLHLHSNQCFPHSLKNIGGYTPLPNKFSLLEPRQSADMKKSTTKQKSKPVRDPIPELLKFLAPYDPAIRAMALDVRAYLLTIEPRATETIYDAYNAVSTGYSFTGRLKECYCHVAVYPKHVNLGFNRGADLDDPQKILQGTGSQVRHITIREKSDLSGPYLKSLVRAAIVNARALAIAGGIPEIEPQSVVKAIYEKRRRPISS